MKCKKIFSMLLALCMVLSSFVAVSADSEGIDFTLAHVTGNPGEIKGDDGYFLTYAEMVRKATVGGVVKPDNVGWSPFVSMNFDEPISKDGEEFKVSFDCEIDGLINSVNKEYTALELRLRLYGNRDSQNPTLGVITKNVQFADGQAYVEFNSYDKIAAAAGSTDHKLTLADLAGDIKSIGIVPSLSVVLKADKSADDAYIKFSNISIEYTEKIEPEYEKVVDMNETMDDEELSTLLCGSEVTSVTYADGVATATLTGTGNNSMVSVMLVDKDEKAYKLKKGDTVNYSVKIKPSKSFETTTGTKGIMMRNGGTYPPSAQPFTGIHPKQTVPANEWTTLSGSWVADKDYPDNAYLNIRPEAAMTLEIDEIIITIEKERIPDITDLDVKSVTADSATFTVKTDGPVAATSMKNYCEINGVDWASSKVMVKTISKTEYEITVKGLGAGVPYEFTLEGADSLMGGKVVVDCEDTVEFTTLFEVDVEAELADTVNYTLVNNTKDDIDAYVVLLRCKDESVVKAEAVEAVEIADEESGAFEVDPLADGEYFRLFVWSFDGAIRSLAELCDLN